MKGSMYISLLLEPGDTSSLDGVADTPNMGLMLGAAILTFLVAAVAIPGLAAGLNTVLHGHWLWPVVGLLVWIGGVAAAVRLAQAYSDQVERMPIDLLATFGSGVADILYTAALVGGVLLGWRARNSLRNYL